MSGKAKSRWFLLAPIILTLLVVTSPVVSWAVDKILPIDYTEADRNSREIWFEFTNTSISRGGCTQLIAGGGEPVNVKVMRSGNFLITFSIYKKASEFLSIQSDPENSVAAVSGINGLKFGKIVSLETITQDITKLIIKYTAGKKKIRRCIFNFRPIRVELRERQAYELAHAEAVKSTNCLG